MPDLFLCDSILRSGHDAPYLPAIDHDYFMQIALEEAKEALREDEVPIGAVVVLMFHEIIPKTTSKSKLELNKTTMAHFEILSRQHNRVEQNHDASAHAEMLALQEAGRKQKNWRLSSSAKLLSSTLHLSNKHNNHQQQNISDKDVEIISSIWLYCTMEPCVMCFSSAQLFRVNHIVFGTPDHRLGSINSPVRIMDTDKNDYKHPFHMVDTVTQIQNQTIQTQCSTMIQEFFRNKRNMKKKT